MYKFVKLNCGHNFNYIPLFNDLVNHKKKFNMMESNSGFLKKDEIPPRRISIYGTRSNLALAWAYACGGVFVSPSGIELGSNV
jgi:hypothetical protein